MMLAIPVVYPGKVMPESIDILVHKPRVETVTVIDRHTIPSRRDPVYRFVYSNGAAGTVDQEPYENVPDGATYYVIMCGNYCS